MEQYFTCSSFSPHVQIAYANCILAVLQKCDLSINNFCTIINLALIFKSYLLICVTFSRHATMYEGIIYEKVGFYLTRMCVKHSCLRKFSSEILSTSRPPRNHFDALPSLKKNRICIVITSLVLYSYLKSRHVASSLEQRPRPSLP